MKIKKNKKQKEEQQEIEEKIEEEQIIEGKQELEEKQDINKKKNYKKTRKDVINKHVPGRVDSIKQVPNLQENLPKDKYYYVYGITNKIINNQDIILIIKGLRDKPIQKLDIRDMAVLFSFYPILHPVVEEKEAMLHAEILNKLAARTAIIPMAFGTVFKDREILETVLTKSYIVSKKTLELIKDKIELGIKVVKKESEGIPAEVSKEILKELNNISAKSVPGDMFSERLLLNHSFLVERNKFPQFSDKIGELEKKYSGLKFIYTGPWPVYSFVNINIKAG